MYHNAPCYHAYGKPHLYPARPLAVLPAAKAKRSRSGDVAAHSHQCACCAHPSTHTSLASQTSRAPCSALDRFALQRVLPQGHTWWAATPASASGTTGWCLRSHGTTTTCTKTPWITSSWVVPERCQLQQHDPAHTAPKSPAASTHPLQGTLLDASQCSDDSLLERIQR